MVQAKDTVRMDKVFKTVLIVLVMLSSVFSCFAMYRSGDVDSIDLSVMEDGMEELADLYRTTAAGEPVDTSMLESKIDGITGSLDDLYDKLYASEKEDLEHESLDAYEAEYDDDDLEEFLEDNVEGFDKLRYLEFDEDEGYEVTIINLGLDDEEDKKSIVEGVYDVRYELDDSTDKLKDKVYSTCVITYDDDEGFECEMTFSL